MPNFKLNDVRVILADQRANVRTLLKSAFLDIGIREVIDATKIEQVSEFIGQEATPDIVICDTAISNELCHLIKDVRNNKTGRNPFVCMLGISWNPVRSEVEALVNAGIDSLLVAPLSPQQMFDRIQNLVEKRVDFVVTRDYVGPDRRRDADRTPDRTLLQVPNTLRAKALGEWNAVAMERAIKRAIVEVQARKMEVQAIDIARFVDQMIVHMNTPGAVLEHARLMQLQSVIINLFKTANRLKITHLDELSQATLGVLATLLETYAEPNQSDLDLLRQLAMAIRTALRPEERVKDVAHDIARTVQQAR